MVVGTICNILNHFPALSEHRRKKSVSSIKWRKFSKLFLFKAILIWSFTISSSHCDSFSVLSLKSLTVQTRPTTFINGKLFTRGFGAANNEFPACFISFVLFCFYMKLNYLSVHLLKYELIQFWNCIFTTLSIVDLSFDYRFWLNVNFT